MCRAARWLIVAPVVLFVFATLIASCGGGGGCSGSYNSFGIFVSGGCPTAQSTTGYQLVTITVCQGTVPAVTPTSTATPSKKAPTPTPTACPAATSTAVNVGQTIGFTAQGYLVKKKKSTYQDITNGVGTIWTTTHQSILQSPLLNYGGIYTGVSTGCACITANAAQVSSLPVGVAVGQPVSSCPACPTPTITPTATPTSGAVHANLPAAMTTPGADAGGVYSWVFNAGSPARGPIVAGPDGTAYFISKDSMLHALNSQGAEIFDRPAGGKAPAVDSDGTIFVAGTTTWLYALAPGGIPVSEVDMHAPASPLAASSGTVYVSIGSDIAAVTAGGQVKWRVPDGPANTGIALGTGVVVAADGGGITALAGSGGRLWTFNPAGGFSGLLAESQGVIYAGSGSGTVYALNAETGAELWQADSGAPIIAGPIVATSGAIIFGSDRLYALNQIGTSQWTAGAPLAFGLAADSTGGALDALQSNDIDLFDSAGGVVSSTRSTASVIETGYSPSGLSYVATSDGRLYAFR